MAQSINGIMRAAFKAGKYPNTTPTAAEKKNAIIMIEISGTKGSPAFLWHRRRLPGPGECRKCRQRRRAPPIPPETGAALHAHRRRWPGGCRFPGALGHGHQHDVHDTDASDQKAYCSHRAEKGGHDFVVEVSMVASSLVSMILKLSSSLSERCRRFLKRAWMAADAVVVEALLFTATWIKGMSLLPEKRRWTAFMGMITQSSGRVPWRSCPWPLKGLRFDRILCPVEVSAPQGPRCQTGFAGWCTPPRRRCARL